VSGAPSKVRCVWPAAVHPGSPPPGQAQLNLEQSELDAAIERILTVRALVVGQLDAAVQQHHGHQEALNRACLQGIDLALQAIRSPHMKTLEEVARG